MGNGKVHRSRAHLKSSEAIARLLTMGANRGFKGSRGSTVPLGEARGRPLEAKALLFTAARRAELGKASPCTACTGLPWNVPFCFFPSSMSSPEVVLGLMEERRGQRSLGSKWEAAH